MTMRTVGIWQEVWNTVLSEFSDISDATHIARITLRLLVAAALDGVLGRERTTLCTHVRPADPGLPRTTRDHARHGDPEDSSVQQLLPGRGYPYDSRQRDRVLAARPQPGYLSCGIGPGGMPRPTSPCSRRVLASLEYRPAPDAYELVVTDSLIRVRGSAGAAPARFSRDVIGERLGGHIQLSNRRNERRCSWLLGH